LICHSKPKVAGDDRVKPPELPLDPDELPDDDELDPLLPQAASTRAAAMVTADVETALNLRRRRRRAGGGQPRS
jgi:hypothetical protein